MPQFGSGSQLLGGTDALAQAMASRGVDASILNQQTPASMGGQQPIPQPLPASASPNVSSASPVIPSTVSGSSVPSSEAEIILKALSGRLKSLSESGR